MKTSMIARDDENTLPFKGRAGWGWESQEMPTLTLILSLRERKLVQSFSSERMTGRTDS